MRIIFCLAILVYSLPALSQADRYDAAANWMQLKLDADVPVGLTVADTPIVVVSNRIMQKDSLRFMLQQRDGGKLHYFVVYNRSGIRHVLETQSLEEAVRYMPDKDRDWVTYVEGMGKLFTTDLERGIVLTGMYGVNTIMFDYPSINTSKKRLGNYFFALRNAKKIHADFQPVLTEIKSLRTQGKLGAGHLSMLYHSMGNNMIRQMVLRKKSSPINDCVWVDNIILNAPCVPQAGHRKWLGKVAFSSSIYVNYNPHDFTLGGALLVSKRNQLGMKLHRPVCPEVRYVNFHKLVNKEHNYFLDLPGRKRSSEKAFGYYNIIFHGNSADFADTAKYCRSYYKAIGWDILP